MEKKLLLDATRKSQGFDIPLLPGVCTITRYRVDLTDKVAVIEAVRLSKLAVRWYNKDKGTNYALQRIVKSTGSPCAFLVYCITFLATSNDDPAIPAETFQARVWVKSNLNVLIKMCRKKGNYDPGMLEKDHDDGDQSQEDKDGDDDNLLQEDDDQDQN